MPQRTDTFELGRLGLTAGEGRRLELHVDVDGFLFGGQRYEVAPTPVAVVIDVSRTTGRGYSLRLRFAAEVHGPCMRCLEPSSPLFEVDAREIDQPGGVDELSSPYVDEAEDLDLRRWVRDALALALPAQITHAPDCLGLCPQCGANLNDDPGHAHEREPDPRWAKLSEIRFE